MSVSPLSNSASISTGQTVITLASAVDGLTQSLLSGYIISLNGHPAVVNRTLTDSQIELVSAWNYDSITNGTLYGIATVQGFTQHVEQLNLTNAQLQTALTTALEKINAFKSAAEKDTVANGGSVVESANLKPAAYKEVGTEDGKVLPAEALSAYIKEFITVTDAAEARDKIAFNDGLSPLELSKLMNPMVDLFKKNKGLHHYAGTATFTSGPGTYRDRYGDLQTSAENELREEEDGFLFYDTYTNYALYSDTVGRNPTQLPEVNATRRYTLSAPDTAGWCDFIEDATDGSHYIGLDAATGVFNEPLVIGDNLLFMLEVKTLGVGVQRFLGVGILKSTAGSNDYSSSIFNIDTGEIEWAEEPDKAGIIPTSDGFICWAYTAMDEDRTPSIQVRLSNSATSWAASYVGDGVSGLKVKNLLVAKGETPLPYITTTDAPVTKTADQLQISYAKNFPNPEKPFTYFVRAHVDSFKGSRGSLFRGVLKDKNGDEQDAVIYLGGPDEVGNLHARIGSRQSDSAMVLCAIPNFDPSNTKFSIAVVHDGTDLIIYYNRVEVGRRTNFSPGQFYDADVYIGHGGLVQPALDGQIESLTIYDYALSEAAIKAL